MGAEEGLAPSLLSTWPSDGLPRPDVADHQAEWVTRDWRPHEAQPKRQPRGAGVTTFARKLIALERQRMRHSTPRGLRPRRRGE